MYKLLFLEDEVENIKGILEYLTDSGYDVTVVSTVEDAKAHIQSNLLDVAIFDANLLPEEEISKRKKEKIAKGLPPVVEEEGAGIRLINWTTKNYPELGVLVYSGALTSASDQVKGLTLGADNYIIKHADPVTFEAQLTSLIRRLKPSVRGRLKAGDISLDHNTQVAIYKDLDQVLLTDAEFKLLRYFMNNKNVVISREKLCQAALSRHIYTKEDRAIDTLISKLRKKLELFESEKEFISTIRGKGYIFAP